MNLEGAVIKLLLTMEDRNEALDAFSDLRPEYFSKGARTLYTAIVSFYTKYGTVPSKQQLLTHQSRNEAITNGILAQEHLDVETLEIGFVVEEMKNQYTHLETMRMLESFVHKSITMDREEMIEALSELPLEMELKLQETFKVGTVANTNFFVSKTDHKATQILSGISDSWDYEAGGYFVEDLVLFGGKRGSGKSLVCANMVVAQHLQGNPSLYFTIEMTKEEILGRIICMLSGVSANRYRKNELTAEEEEKAAETIASFFEEGEEVFNKYFRGAGSRDVLEFQRELQATKREKAEGRIIIIDDRNLTAATIDAKVNTYKKIYGSKLKLVCVDYLNQVKLSLASDADMYDWKNQIFISKLLKEIARKYLVCMVSPYQIDASGEARMSKGILDAADIAQVIHRGDGAIVSFENVKARGVKDGSVHSVTLDEVCLLIDPKEVSQDREIPEESEPQETINTWDLR
jgi:KaiC/GvpD/RAD55 family RecA-like ATPase